MSATAPPSAAPASARDPWFDNAKMALVTLVVVGHAWTLLPQDAFEAHLYDFLYLWHVPAFVLVTGYLSRSFDYSTRRLWQLVRTVAVPYVLFEAALALFRYFVGGVELKDLWADPHWPMWYLSALFFWRLLTPVMKALPAAVLVAVAASLVGGLVAGNTLDAARILGLLPFFVAGLKASPAFFARLRTAQVRLAGLVFAALAWWLTSYTDRFAATEWLYYRTRYDQLDVSDGRAIAVRACLLLLGAAGALSFLSWVPGRGGWFSRLGQASLVVYLFHGFVVLGAEYAGYPALARAHPLPALLATTAGAVGLALLLASPPVAGRLQHLVDHIGYAQGRLKHGVELTAVAEEVNLGMHDALPDKMAEAGESPLGDRRPHRHRHLLTGRR